MLAAARAENASRQIVVVGPGHAGRRSLPAGFLRDAAARGFTVLTGTVDIWEAVARAEAVYTAGGEAGFLALLAGARIRCFSDSFYSGWGITTDEPGVSRKPLRRTVDESICRRLPPRDPVSRSVPSKSHLFRGHSGDRRRVAENRGRQPRCHGLPRNVVLEAWASPRFSAVEQWHASLSAYQECCACGSLP
jgi:hypothetical protein